MKKYSFIVLLFSAICYVNPVSAQVMYHGKVVERPGDGVYECVGVVEKFDPLTGMMTTSGNVIKLSPDTAVSVAEYMADGQVNVTELASFADLKTVEKLEGELVSFDQVFDENGHPNPNMITGLRVYKNYWRSPRFH